MVVIARKKGHGGQRRLWSLVSPVLCRVTRKFRMKNSLSILQVQQEIRNLKNCHGVSTIQGEFQRSLGSEGFQGGSEEFLRMFKSRSRECLGISGGFVVFWSFSRAFMVAPGGLRSVARSFRGFVRTFIGVSECVREFSEAFREARWGSWGFRHVSEDFRESHWAF